MKREQKWQWTPSAVFMMMVVALVIGFIGGTRKNEILATIGPVIGYSVEEHYIDLSSVERTFSALSSNFDGDLDKNKLIMVTFLINGNMLLLLVVIIFGLMIL